MIIDVEPIPEGEGESTQEPVNENLPSTKTYEIPEAVIFRLKMVVEDLTAQNKALKEDLADVLTLSYFMGKVFQPSKILTTASFLMKLVKSPEKFKEILIPYHEVMQKHPDVLGEVDRKVQIIIKENKIKI